MGPITTIGGIVLCGGRSSRMGRPKEWLSVGDEVMLQRVVRILRDVVSPVVVVAAPGQDVPPLPADVRIVRDEVEGRGPLAGLAGGLAALDGRTDAAYLSACDVPLLLPGFVRRVIERLSFGAGSVSDGLRPHPSRTLPPKDLLIAVPRADGYFHPLAAVYRLAVRDTVMSLLAADRLRPTDLFDAVPTRVIEPHELADVDPTFQSLRNLNTPDEYEAALRAAGFGRRGSTPPLASTIPASP